MDAGETAGALQFRLSMGGLMGAHLLQNLRSRREGIRHGADRFVTQLQLLAAGGKITVDGGGSLVQPLHKTGSITDDLGGNPAHGL